MPQRKELAGAQKSWASHDYMTDQRYLAPDDCAIGQQHASYRCIFGSGNGKAPLRDGCCRRFGACLTACYLRPARFRRSIIECHRSENYAIKRGHKSRATMKVSDKGGLSVYGLGRFPVTLYKEQWIKLLGMSADIERFIREHDHELKTKE